MSENDDDKYYKLGDAVDEFNYSYGAKDKTVSALKMVGKGLFNVGKYLITDGKNQLESYNEKTREKLDQKRKE